MFYYLQKKINVLFQMEYWMEKYDKDVENMQHDLDVLKQSKAKDLERLQELTKLVPQTPPTAFASSVLRLVYGIRASGGRRSNREGEGETKRRARSNRTQIVHPNSSLVSRHHGTQRTWPLQQEKEEGQGKEGKRQGEEKEEVDFNWSAFIMRKRYQTYVIVCNKTITSIHYNIS